MILDGDFTSSHFHKLREEINRPVEVGDNDKLNDVCFHIHHEAKNFIGQSNIDFIVDKNFNGDVVVATSNIFLSFFSFYIA
jgi:hypothetical protein